jgi:protein O-GlcNAc transferase
VSQEAVRAAIDSEGRGDRATAIANLRKAVSKDGRQAEAWHFLALLEHREGSIDEAEAHHLRALELAPTEARFHANFGNFLISLHRFEEAARSFDRALDLAPRSARALLGLSAVAAVQGRASECIALIQEACASDPSLPEAWSALCGALARAGRLDEARLAVAEALRRFPDSVQIRQDVLLTEQYFEAFGRQASLQAHSALAGLLGPRPARPFRNNRDPDRRLRIGCLSPDLRRHAVSSFALPVVRALSVRQDASVWLYSSTLVEDEVSAAYRALAVEWRPIAAITASDLERRVEADKIDVLIDLAGHTSGTRVLDFSLRLAPVQATWIGYPDTTGVPNVDFRFVDSVTDPAGADQWATERLVRLDPCFLCYEPALGTVEPARADTALTYGSFNNRAKVSEETLRVWARLLASRPGARLLLKADTLRDPGVTDGTLAEFERHGVSRDRIRIVPYTATFEDHLRLYADMDVALDTFPYNGTTTTAEALCMGVPVVTMLGETHRARVSASLLRAAGFPACVAADEEAFLAVANRLADEAPARDRRAMRRKVLESPLCDAEAMAERFMAAVRDAWAEWCESQG